MVDDNRSRALTGWTVVVTRAEGARGKLGAMLEREGAKVIRFPLVEIGPPGDRDAFERACATIDDHDWLVVTSPRAVDAVAARLSGAPRTRVASVGSATSEAARAAGWTVALEGPGPGGEALAKALIAEGVGRGARLLFPASDRAGSDLADALRDAGAEIRRVVAYETRVRAADLPGDGSLSAADAITFTSPSAVAGWERATGGRPRAPLSATTHFVAIGPTTAARLDRLGVSPRVPSETTFEGMVHCLTSLRANP